MLACARIGAPHNVVFGGFYGRGGSASGWSFSEAKALITADEARRGGSQRLVKSKVDEVMGRPRVARDQSLWSATPAATARGRGSRRPGTTRPSTRPTPIAPPRHLTPSTRSTSSTPRARPRSQRDPSHDGRLPDAFGLDAPQRSRPEARLRRLPGAPATSAGSPANATSSTGRSPTARPSVMFEGAPAYPDKDIWWEIVERYGATILYCAPTAIRTTSSGGPEYAGKHDLSSLSSSERSASRSTRRRGSGTTR